MPHTDCSEKVPTICLGSCCYMKMLEVSKKIPSDHCHTVQYTLVPIPSFSLRCQAPVVNRQKCERFHSRQQSYNIYIRYIFSNVKIQTYTQLTTNTDQSFDQPANRKLQLPRPVRSLSGAQGHRNNNHLKSAEERQPIGNPSLPSLLFSTFSGYTINPESRTSYHDEIHFFGASFARGFCQCVCSFAQYFHALLSAAIDHRQEPKCASDGRHIEREDYDLLIRHVAGT